MTKYLMCIHWGHMCTFTSSMKFLSLILWLRSLCKDADNVTNAKADTNDTDNYARRTNHDYIGSFGRIPNEPKTNTFSYDLLLPSNLSLIQRYVRKHDLLMGYR